MKFGTYFAYWEKSWQADYLKYIDKVRTLGFDVLEVTSDIMQLTDSQLQALKRRAADAGVKLTACLGLPAHLDVSSSDESIRKAGIEYMKNLCRAMDKAGIDRVGGIIYAYWPADYSKPVDKETARRHSIRSMREIAGYADSFGIVLNLEVVNRFEQYLLNDAREALGFLDDLGSPNVKVMLDTFHMNIEEDSMGNAIRLAGKQLGHFHIGENNRKVPGKGRMPWLEIGKALQQIEYQGCVVMEPFIKKGGIVGQDIRVWRDLSEGIDDAQMDKEIEESLRFVKNAFLSSSPE